MYKINYKICVVLFLLITNLLLSQNQLDSLKQLLKIATTDTVKLRLYSQLSEVCDESDIPLYTLPAIKIADKLLNLLPLNPLQKNIENSVKTKQVISSSKKNILNYYALVLNNQSVYEGNLGNNQAANQYLEKALKIQILNNDSIQVAGTLHNLGNNYYQTSQISRAIEAYSKSVEILKKLNKKTDLIMSYNGLSLAYRKQGNILVGIDYCLKNLKLCEELKDESSKPGLYNILALFYFDLNDFQKVLDYSYKSVEISKRLNIKKYLANAYSNISKVYFKQNNIDEASKYLTLSVKLFEELGRKNELISAYNNVGYIYLMKKNYELAIKMYEQATQLALQLNSPLAQSTCYFRLAEAYYIQNNNAKTLEYALKAYTISSQLKAPYETQMSASILCKVYARTNQYQKALQMTNHYYALRDSVLNDSTKQVFLKKQFKYEYDTKALADSVKNVEQKQIITTQLAIQKTELKQQKIIRISLIVGIIIIAAFLIFVFNRLQITSKQKLLIQRQTQITQIQKNELEIKNKNITESMEAAKEIQYIIFPSENELQTIFKNYFLLFKPIDNLSGDFLWIRQIEEKAIIVVGDCTGHGVPASLLTLFANEFLNKIILQKQITSASQILEEVNIEIYNYLKRKLTSKKGVNEGMDIGICIVDKLTNTLSYAGSKIDLYAINTHNELKMAESYKIELGKQLRLNNVTEQTFLLNEINGFYLTTDGLKNQLKYRSNKTKFGFNGFENFIKDNINVPFPEQKSNIQNIYSQLTVSEKQIDDILVFGFKI